MQQAREILHGVLYDILERLAFLFADDVDEITEEMIPSTFWRAAIEFHGIVSGKIEVAAPEDLCLTLAANTMGVEPDMLEGLTPKDALGEFLNIVCGEFIEVRHGAKEIFRLTIPTLSVCTTEQWQAMAAMPATVQLLVEDQPMLARAETKDN